MAVEVEELARQLTVKMDSKKAEDLVRRYLAELRRAISEPSILAMDLFSSFVISRSVYNEAISYDGGITKERKVQSLCDALLQEVAVKPSLLVHFVEAARDHSPAMKDVCERISEETFYVELEKVVQMKRATERGHETRVGGEGSTKDSETQVYLEERCTVSPVTSPGDQLQAALHSPPSKEIRHKVPLRVKRNFDFLRIRFGKVFVTVFTIIEKEDLQASKKYLSATFQDLGDSVRNLESMKDLEKFLCEHSSFSDFPMLEGLAYNFSLEEVEKELVSFTELRDEKYSQILAADFNIAGVDECVKDSQTKMVFVVGWAKNEATLLQFQQMITQAFENAGKFISLNAVRSSLLTFICAAPTWAVASLIRVGKENINILRELGVLKLIIGHKVILNDQEVQEKLEFLKETLSDAIREMSPISGDPELTALQAEIIGILSNTSAFDDKAIQQLVEKMSHLKACVQRTRSDEQEVMERFKMEIKMSHNKSAEITKLTTDLENVKKEKKVVTKLLSEIVCDIIREVVPVTGDPQLSALQEGIVSILSRTPSEFDDSGIQQLEQKMHLFKACVKKKRADQQRLQMEVMMLHAENSQIPKLLTDLKRANEEYEQMKEKDLEGMEELNKRISILETDLQSKEVENFKLHSDLQARDQRIATLESPLRTKKQQLIAALDTEEKQCSDAAVQANFLSVTEFGQEEVKLSGEKIFEATANRSEKYQRSSSGFLQSVRHWIGIGPLPVQSLYRALVFHKQMARTIWQIVFVVVKDIHSFVEYELKVHRDYFLNQTFLVQFEEKSESISVEMSPCEKELWRMSSIMDSTDNVIFKRVMDNCQAGLLTFPKCAFLAEWISPTDAVKDLKAEIKLTQEDHAPKTVVLYVNVSLRPTQDSFTTQDQGTYCQQGDFVNKVAAKIPAAWFHFGISLGIKIGKLETIEQTYPNNPLRCFIKVYSIWEQERVRPLTWEVVVEILKSEIMAQKALSSELATEYNLQ